MIKLDGRRKWLGDFVKKSQQCFLISIDGCYGACAAIINYDILLQCSWHPFVYFILLWGWFIFFRALFLRKSFFRIQLSRIAASKSYEHWMHCILCMQMCICVSQLFFVVFVFTQMNSLDLSTLRTWSLNSQALIGLLSSKVMSERTKKQKYIHPNTHIMNV